MTCDKRSMLEEQNSSRKRRRCRSGIVSADQEDTSNENVENQFKVKILDIQYLETELKILQSLIPGLAKRQDISEVMITDCF